MKVVCAIAGCVVLVVICCASSPAQSPAPTTQHYSKDGLSFEYGDGWSLKDNSNQLAQHLLLSRPGSSTLIMVLAYRLLITSPDQLVVGRRDVTERFIEDAKRKLGAPAVKVVTTTAQLTVGEDVADGVILHGSIDGAETTAEVYSYLGKLRFINVAYIRPDKDSPQDDQSWLTLLRTLKIETPLVGNKEYRGVNLVVDEEKLNGRAISLPKPEYPAFARQSRAGGTVLVRVIVDEKGNVAEIVSVSGHPALVEAAAKAARKAKFTPTAIAGQPVRVTGLITYNFVSR